MPPKSPSAADASHPQAADLIALLDATDGIALVGYDLQMRVTRWSPAAEYLFGYKADWLIGHASADLLHPSGELERLMKSARVFPLQVRIVATSRSGDNLPMKAVISRSLSPGGVAGWLVLYHDLSAQERAEAEMRKMREQLIGSPHYKMEEKFLGELLRHTAANIQIGLLVQEMGSEMITYINEGFTTITGIQYVEALGHTIADLFAYYPRIRENLVDYMGAVHEAGLSAGVEPRHWEVELPSGKRTIEVYARLIKIEGFENEFILLIIEDNTDRQRLQLQLVQSEKLAAVGQLAAGIAHEIRNPLNTIFNALFDLQEIVENPTEEMAEDISISMDEIRRVQDIINNLLDFARESDKGTGLADLNEVVQKTVRLVQHDLDTRGITVHSELGEIPDVALSSNALKQILINLITNASQAMNRGGTLTLRTGRIEGPVPPDVESAVDIDDEPTVRDPESAVYRPPRKPRRRGATTGDPQEHVILEVSDTGEGIPPELLANIFNPFFTTKDPGAGTGLGLSVVHSLIRDTGGAIRVESTPGVGTTFILELPAYAV